jgi:ArsR family transcriptional regulator
VPTKALGVVPAACCAPLAVAGISDDDAQTTAAVLKALADPNRVRIVNLLATAPEPVCVCDITSVIGLSQPTISFHLKKLTATGLLKREQRGVWAYYELDRAILRQLSAIFDTKGRVP